MIANLVSDPMKPVWINLELYFKRYEFSSFWGFFQNFFEFNSIYFELNSLNIYIYINHVLADMVGDVA